MTRSAGPLATAVLGEALGEVLGEALGDALGEVLGDALGEALGEVLGLLLGEVLGEALGEIITELDATPVTIHLSDVKGPVRDVLHRAGIWQRLDGRLHATAHLAVIAVQGQTVGVSTLRAAGIDERPAPLAPTVTTTNT